MAADPILQAYARAFQELAQAEGVLGRVEEEFHRLGELVKQSPELLQFLKDPNIQREGKRQALSQLFTGRVHPLVLNALLTLSDLDRAGSVRTVIEEFLTVSAASKQRVAGEVTTAIPLDDATRQRLEAELNRLTGQHVQLFQKVDPAILGGAIIQVGEQVIDGSLRRKLEQLKETLLK